MPMPVLAGRDFGTSLVAPPDTLVEGGETADSPNPDRFGGRIGQLWDLALWDVRPILVLAALIFVAMLRMGPDAAVPPAVLDRRGRRGGRRPHLRRHSDRCDDSHCFARVRRRSLRGRRCRGGGACPGRHGRGDCTCYSVDGVPRYDDRAWHEVDGRVWGQGRAEGRAVRTVQEGRGDGRAGRRRRLHAGGGPTMHWRGRHCRL